jgi:hypothetical protein
MDEKFSTLIDWIWSSRCLTLLCTSTQFNSLKWVSGGGIYSPRHQKSHWLTSTEKCSVGWTDALNFATVSSSGALPRHLAVEILWHKTSIRWTTDAAHVSSVRPMLKGFALKPLYWHFHSRRMNQCWPSVHPVLKLSRPEPYCLASSNHWIDWWCASTVLPSSLLRLLTIIRRN